ncbi:MAG: hypothetical protein ACJ72N_14455 [Labedaea sp.]
MTFHDDETVLSGNRELIERELTRSVAQVLHLVPGRPGADQRSLRELGVDIVLSVAFVHAERGTEASFAAEVAAFCAPTAAGDDAGAASLAPRQPNPALRQLSSALRHVSGAQ